MIDDTQNRPDYGIRGIIQMMNYRYSAITTVKYLLLTALAFCTGCASLNTQKDVSWLDFVATQSISTNSFMVVDGESYKNDRILSDIRLIENIAVEMDAIVDKLSHLTTLIDAQGNKYFTESENRQTEFVLFQFIRYRDMLWNIMDFYRNASYPNTEMRTKGAAVFMYSAIKLNYYSSRLVAISINNRRIIKILNASHSRYNIKKNSYDAIFLNITDISSIKLIDTAWGLFEKELYNSDSTLARLSRTSPEFEFLNHLKPGYFDYYVQTRYILYASGKLFANVENRLRHTQARRLGSLATEAAEDGFYHVQGTVYKNVARIKNPRIHIVEFSDKQAEQIKSMLLPGDIILTYTAGYMSNVFLPGNFKHGITYIGTVPQRHKAGLTMTEFICRTVSPQQLSALTNNVSVNEYPPGYEANVIEAVAEGVIINSLDYLLKTHINRLVVLRPIISAEERIDQLLDLFLHVGVPYDFNFNFSNDSYQCCTELIYRTLNNKGSINMQFSKLKGKWILSADGIANYFLNTNPDSFEIILLAEKSDKDNHAKIITGSESLVRLRELMQ